MNEDNIDKVYDNIRFERKIRKKSKDLLKDAIDYNSLFLSYGAPETELAKMTDKNLINDMLSEEFDNLADDFQCLYFQEFHNRIAKSLKIPAVNVIIKSDSSSDSASFATSKHRIPIDFIFETNGERFPNVQLEINNKINMTNYFEGLPLNPSSRGLENIFTIIHETRHIAQLYAEHLLSSKSEILKDNTLNAVAFYDLMENTEVYIGKFYGILRNDFYPNIKGTSLSENEKEFLQSYELTPAEIDARKYALEKMGELQKKGFLENTNWEKYKGFYLAEDYEALNFERKFSTDECPAINFLKSKKNIIFNNFNKLDKLSNGKFNSDYPKQVAKLINFEKYFDSIQNYYNKLKEEIRKIMIDDAERIKNAQKLNSDKDEFSESQYYKVRYGSDQINNYNGEYKHSIINKFTGIYKPETKIETEEKNLNAYRINKEIRKKRKEEREKQREDCFSEQDFDFWWKWVVLK